MAYLGRNHRKRVKNVCIGRFTREKQEIIVNMSGGGRYFIKALFYWPKERSESLTSMHPFRVIGTNGFKKGPKGFKRGQKGPKRV